LHRDPYGSGDLPCERAERFKKLEAQIRAKVRSALSGFEVEADREVEGIVAEYFERKRLADIGYTFDGSELPAAKAVRFLIISTEIDKYEREKIQRETSGPKG
jgi:hypothetical protein